MCLMASIECSIVGAATECNAVAWSLRSMIRLITVFYAVHILDFNELQQIVELPYCGSWCINSMGNVLHKGRVDGFSISGYCEFSARVLHYVLVCPQKRPTLYLRLQPFVARHVDPPELGTSWRETICWNVRICFMVMLG